MEERKWEDMSEDCLVNVFGWLGLDSRLLDIPLVCKAWYRAVRDPLCWQYLVFPYFDSIYSRLQTKLIKFVVNKSQRCAIVLVVPFFCSIEELIYFSEECPALKMIELPENVCDNHSDIIPSLILKWKNLQFLSLGNSSCIVEILECICIHLPNFSGLIVTSSSRAIDYEITSAIVSLSPKLKYLTLKETILERENLMIILKGCKELVHFDVRNCFGFYEVEEEILEFASAIKNFHCQGSIAEEFNMDDWYHYYVTSGDYYSDNDSE